MLYLNDISRLYENVFENDMQKYKVSDKAVKCAIENIQHVYWKTKLCFEQTLLADYTDPGHRCGYIHKYAALHTAMVRDMLGEAVHENSNFFRRLILPEGEHFKLCSLGGGPGTDVIGALATLHAKFGNFDSYATIIDYMDEWRNTFKSILKEFSTGLYGAFGSTIKNFLKWDYVRADLLEAFGPQVIKALSSASLVTMIKFTSAAACMDTYSMIKNILTSMKPGAAFLFIDNDGGGFHELIVKASEEFKFRSIFGPRRRNYFNRIFKKRKYGYDSCYKTKVIVHIFQKPFIKPHHNTSFVYANRRAPDNRRVFLKNKPLLLSSLPPPFSYLDPDANSYNPISAMSVTHTSFSCKNADATSSKENCDFSEDATFEDSDIISPLGERRPASHIVNAPTISGHKRSISTDTQPRAKRACMQDCSTLKLRNFKRHISQEIYKVKASARSVFKKINKSPSCL